ncbi:MAG: serine/threonine-protein kinase [Deltaproteobacteria bacterium]|nr:serine/threonine-protein kinase [Deltaproteobacteria bacterium]
MRLRRGPRQNALTFRAGALVGGRYRIVRLLGAGGMGEVFEAYDTLIESLVALKTLRGAHGTLDPSDVANLRREAQVARKVKHQNVCRVLRYGTHKATAAAQPLPFIVMEKIAGEPLSDYCKTIGTLSSTRVYHVALQACAGLAAIHAARALHRDIKPDNLFVEHLNGGDKRIKITDFGLARLTGPGTGAITLARVGTFAYMAPEVLAGKAASPSSDVWSMGVTLYQLLTGQLPERNHAGRPRFPRPVPGVWVPVLTRCLAADKSRRYPSAIELLCDLRAMQGKSPPRPLRQRLLLKRQRWAPVMLGVCIGTLAALLLRW